MSDMTPVGYFIAGLWGLLIMAAAVASLYVGPRIDAWCTRVLAEAQREREAQEAQPVEQRQPQEAGRRIP